MSRREGPTKGLVVIINPETKEAAILELEPFECESAHQFEQILENHEHPELYVATDPATGVKYAYLRVMG